MKTHEHLVEVDRLLALSWMYLMTVDELVEHNFFIHAELLDILQLFTMKCSKEISKSTSTVSVKVSQKKLHLYEKSEQIEFTCSRTLEKIEHLEKNSLTYLYLIVIVLF